MAALALLALVPTVALAQSGALEDGLNAVERDRAQTERDLDDAREREGDARERLIAVEAELETLVAELAELEQRHAAAEAAEADARDAALQARRQLEVVLAELAETEAHFDLARQRLEARVRAAFKYGQVSFLEAFTGTSDIAEFLNSGTYVARVLEVDRELVDEVVALLAAVEVQRADAQQLRVDAEREAAEAEAAAAEVATAVAEQQRVAEQLEERRAEREAVYEELRDDRAAIEDHLEGLEAESARIESQLAEIARQQAAEQARLEQERRAREAAEQSSGGQGGSQQDSGGTAAPGGTADGSQAGGWLRPTSGRLTSGFGPRWGRNHNGVDIAAPIGTPVVAARAGTVVHVTNGCNPTSSWGCGGGFGNHVIVAHAGGMATVYAHLSTVATGSGQQVSAGQQLGGIGNSGSSYGAHLHFEVREAGVPRNPCGYISC